MTYTEFKNKYNGKFVDYDGAYGAQCWDLGQKYFIEVLGLPASVLGGCGLVSNMLYPPKRNVLNQYFDEVPTNAMVQGDVCIWEYGHIAIFDNWDGNACWYFSQNPNPCAVMKINGNGLHAFRRKGSSPTPTPTPSTNHKVGETVKISGVYKSSSSTEKLTPAVTEGKITKIVSGARNPYLLNDGNIGWVNDSCIVSSPSSNKRYLNLLPSVSSWTVYKSNNSYVPNGNDVAGKLNPQKFGGLTYEILQDMGNYHFKIHTSNFGDVYIAGNPNKYACTITNSPVYPTGSY